MQLNPATTIKTRTATSPLGGPKPSTTNAAPSLSAAEISEQFNCMGIDTRLIAAAPELYDALTSLHDAISADQSGYEDRDELYQLVTSAIAKAEGESEDAA